MRAILFFVFLIAGCAYPRDEPDTATQGYKQTGSELVGRGPVLTGAQVLAGEDFERLRSKRVGFIVNHTALVDSVHLIDVAARSPHIKVAALFGPEHGLRGQADAGERIENGRDEQTGAPVFSLYGKTLKPTPEMLQGVDALVFDIQDIGARFYTYISTMGLAMQAAAEAEIPFVVLDRPNPLGGNYVSGFVLDPEYRSFVGQYSIPIAHGMTVGELARMIQGEQMLSGLENLQLEVVQMQNWTRDMLWPSTGLPWLAPSPNIPDFETALIYPGACFFEATSASEGRGTRDPFKLLGAPWVNATTLADTLNRRNLPGVRFEAAQFTPQSITGMSSDPKLKGQRLEGIRYVVVNPERFRPVEAGIHVLHAFSQQATRQGKADFISRPEWLAKLAGVGRFYDMLASGAQPETIISSWKNEVQAFEDQRKPYLLY